MIQAIVTIFLLGGAGFMVGMYRDKLHVGLNDIPGLGQYLDRVPYIGKYLIEPVPAATLVGLAAFVAMFFFDDLFAKALTVIAVAGLGLHAVSLGARVGTKITGSKVVILDKEGQPQVRN